MPSLIIKEMNTRGKVKLPSFQVFLFHHILVLCPLCCSRTLILELGRQYILLPKNVIKADS